MESSLRAVLAVAGPGLAVDEFPWERLRHEHTGAIRAAIVERYSPRGANKILSALRGVLKACWRQQLMSETDYRHAIDMKSVTVSGHVKAGRRVTLDEIGALYAACAADPTRGAHDGAFLSVLLNCGLRRAEACALDADDYNPVTGGLRVRYGKGGKEREVYLPTKARVRFERWWRTLDVLPLATHELPVFRYIGKMGRGGRLRVTEVGAILADVAKRAKVAPFTAHDFRRTFATTLLDEGVDLVVVRDLMGHSNTNTTAMYDRRGEAAKRSAVEKLPFDI